MKAIGWLFFWLASVVFGADALMSLEQQSLTLVSLGEISQAVAGGKAEVPQALSAIPTIIPLLVIGVLAMALALRGRSRRTGRKRRIFGDGRLR
jgi:hypothetical protein